MDESALGYRFLIVAAVIGMNAFFAASEVALVSVRQTRLKQLAAEGQSGARAALSLLANPERLLSVVQVGVTLASLGLGWAGEGTLFAFFSQLFGTWITPATEGLFHGLSFALAFAVMTYAHVVIGEVVPKNLAIENADRLAVAVAPALLLFYRVSSPFVAVIEKSAATLSRWLGSKGDQQGGHSPQELKFIVSASRRLGHLHNFEESAIGRLVDLQDYLVREVMVPRSEIVSVPVGATLSDVLETMRQHHHSRIPVYEKEPEHVVGIVHYKDMLNVWRDQRVALAERHSVRRFDLRLLMTKPHVVPETKPLNQMIDEFRKERSHMAIVVDEFGTVVGLITLEDVMEQIFGEIEDEHDIHLPPVTHEAALLDLDGSINIRDLETQYGIDLPVDAGFETLAGYMLFRLGDIPATGDMLEEQGMKFTILEMDRNRIARIRVERELGAVDAGGQAE